MRAAWIVVLVALAGCMDDSEVPRGPDADERDDQSDGSGNGSPGNGSAGNGSAGTQNTTYEVEISEFTYVPETLEIQVGESVTWTNRDQAAHTATGDDGTPDSGTLSQGDSHTETFDEAGTYAYTCTFHPSMQGTIIVA